MAKKKNKNKELPEVHLSAQDEVASISEEVGPSIEVPQDVAVPDTEVEQAVDNCLHFSQLIGQYIEGNLSPSVYKLGLVDTTSNNPFDLVVSNDDTTTASTMYPAYLVKSNKKYTTKDFTVFLNAKVYSNLPPGNQIFIKPYLVTLDKRLIPEDIKLNSKGEVKEYDLTDPTDSLALFINVCNTSTLLKDKRLPYKKIYDFMHESFTNYLIAASEGVILKEVTDEDIFG